MVSELLGVAHLDERGGVVVRGPARYLLGLGAGGPQVARDREDANQEPP